MNEQAQEQEPVLEMTDVEVFLTRAASRMVGSVLNQVEATFVPGQQTLSQSQIEKFKQLIENHMYEYRDKVLRVIIRLEEIAEEAKINAV